MTQMYNDLVKIAKVGVTVELVDDNVYKIKGFYKSGEVIVNLNKKIITARYNETTSFDVDDLLEKLVCLNYEWWERSKDRHEGWSVMNKEWESLSQGEYWGI